MNEKVISYIEEISIILEKIPHVVWSAVIASLLTIFGVWLTNRGSANRQMDLINHEKEKFLLQQSMILKKEVFLEMAKSFANVLDVIVNLINLDFSNNDIRDKMNNHGGYVAKSYLVANENSLVEILNYSSEVSQTYIELSKERAILLDYKEAVEIYQNTIDSNNLEKDRILSMLKEFNIYGKVDKGTFDYLYKDFELRIKVIEEFTLKIEEIENILKPLHLSFIKKCLEEHSKLVTLISPMTIEIRKELNNNQDSKIFVDALNLNNTKMQKSFKSLLS